MVISKMTKILLCLVFLINTIGYAVNFNSPDTPPWPFDVLSPSADLPYNNVVLGQVYKEPPPTVPVITHPVWEVYSDTWGTNNNINKINENVSTKRKRGNEFDNGNTIPTKGGLNELKKPRKHSTISLLDAVNEAFNMDNPSEVGLLWVEMEEVFAIDWDKFFPYYRKRGKSTAKDLNIKNRFGRRNRRNNSKDFEKAEEYTVPDNFDAVYRYLEPEKNTNARKSKKREQYDNISSDKSKKPEQYDNISSDEEQEKSIFDPREDDIKKCIRDAFEDGCKLPTFLDKLQAELVKRGVNFNDPDKKNWRTLLIIEGAQDDFLSSEFLEKFLRRFDPSSSIISNIRNFVSSGAAWWYMDLLDNDKTAGEIFKSQFLDNQNYYFVRGLSIGVPIRLDKGSLLHVFSLSYREKGQEPKHVCIYKNDSYELCIMNQENEFECFSSIKDVIYRILMNVNAPSPISPISSELSKGLVLPKYSYR